MENKYKIVPLDEFNLKLSELRKNNNLVDRLVNDLGTWEKLPDRLIQNLFKLLDCKPAINKY